MKNIIQILIALSLAVAAVISLVPAPAQADVFIMEREWSGQTELIVSEGIHSAEPLPLPPSLKDSHEYRETVRVYSTAEKCIRIIPLQEYLIGVLAAEMPASYFDEALAAQAVAARTYLERKISLGGCSYHDCDICTSSAHCQAYADQSKRRSKWGEDFSYYEEKLTRAVTDTAGWLLTCDGKVIDALYHASSPGATETCSAVYGSNRSYLVSVSSPEDADSATSEVSFSVGEFVRLVNRNIPDAQLRVTGLASMVRISDYTDSGRVKSVRLGGATVGGSYLRGLLSLRSTEFTVRIANGTVTFTVRGFGHGLGMSQKGANEMARRGSTCEEILLHYYTGVVIKK